MPATVSLTSGKEFRCDDEPEQVVQALEAADTALVRLQVGGQDVYVRPDHVVAVSRAASRTAHYQ